MGDKPLLLIVDDDPLIQDVLEDFFAGEFAIVGAAHFNDVKSVLMQSAKPPDFALVDLGLPPTPHEPAEGFSVIGALQTAAPDCAIVVVSGQDARRHGQRARALGAADYAEKPVEPKKLREMLLRARRAVGIGRQTMGLIGESPPVQMVREQIRLIAPVSYPVLITGESGAGKEVIARALHTAGRKDRPFLAVSCAAIPEHLVEPTLFGHAKGAFTGAAAAAGGYLGDAADGTLLLDEIGDLPDGMQPKLLRVLETGEYQRVGETRARQCSARIIAASNRLRQHANGGIRDDLYYRLGVFTIQAPPLRQLGGDRFLLLTHFLNAVAADLSAPPFTLSSAAKKLWGEYRFPGNVRELKNIVARLQVKYPGQEVGGDALRGEMCAGDEAPEAANAGAAARLARDYARAVLAEEKNDINAAVKRLRVSKSELRALAGE